MKKILQGILSWGIPLAVSAGLIVGAGVTVGMVRHHQDEAWCKKVTPTSTTVKGVSQPIDARSVSQARASCVAQRRKQRGVFGAVWRTGGKETAICAVRWGTYQQLSDTDAEAAAAVLEPYGIPGTLDAGSRADQQKFLSTCVAGKART
ncbi:MAG TPA: hypothetical protein VHL53_07320 [Acidimicrobiia bacterium]|nr:hypothetical protein [Acidimicrobiia bacterium]